MLKLARIVSGAVQGSQLVGVECTDADGTRVLVHKGERLLGYGELENGACSVILSSGLATNDVLQASVEEKGSRCDSPVVVKATNIKLTGWKTPTEIEFTDENGQTVTMSAELFRAAYGYLPASLYDPSGLAANLQPEWILPPACDIVFDVLVERQSGQTTVTVQNPQFTKGGTLARWNGGGWENTLSKVYTANAAVVIDVRGEDDDETRYTRKTVTLTVATLPSAPQPDSKIKYASWRNFGADIIRVMVNTRVDCEARANGGSWVTLAAYELDYREALFSSIADGPNQIDIRVSGETDSNKWVTMTFTKGY